MDPLRVCNSLITDEEIKILDTPLAREVARLARDGWRGASAGRRSGRRCSRGGLVSCDDGREDERRFGIAGEAAFDKSETRPIKETSDIVKVELGGKKREVRGDGLEHNVDTPHLCVTCPIIDHERGLSSHRRLLAFLHRAWGHSLAPMKVKATEY